MSQYAKNQKNDTGSQRKRLSIGVTHEMTQILEWLTKTLKKLHGIKVKTMEINENIENFSGEIEIIKKNQVKILRIRKYNPLNKNFTNRAQKWNGDNRRKSW